MTSWRRFTEKGEYTVEKRTCMSLSHELSIPLQGYSAYRFVIRRGDSILDILGRCRRLQRCSTRLD